MIGFLLMILLSQHSYAQDIPVVTEQQLENQTDADQAETEDDNWLQEMQEFRKHPLNINTAGEEELDQLRVLTGLQISNLVIYRKLFGNLISIYELQAVPGWDVYTIKKIVPYISVNDNAETLRSLSKRFRNGDHSLLLRLTRVFEKSKGYDRTISGSSYMGDPQKILLRYRYNYKNLLQFGLVGEKDAGEQFFKGAQKAGFDFYSIHLFSRKTGVIQALALGDFTVNMGQGLIQWQSLAFKKNSDVMGIKRQSAVLRPYSSAGEFFFNRGAGITLQHKKFESTVFISKRKLSANTALDTTIGDDIITSFLSSGYHRTVREAEDKNNIRQFSLGANFLYKAKRFHAGVNGVYHHYNDFVKKRDESYNLYAIGGKNWSNVSMDYNYTFSNMHFFGEAALDKNLQKAFVNGLLISADPKADISFLYRHISPAYQAVYGNAFTESTLPSNENGFYTGISVRPVSTWRLDAYADIYRFPWLKYQADAPGNGADYLCQLTYTPNKEVELYSRFRTEHKQLNQRDNGTTLNYLVFVPKKSWRIHINYKLNRSVTLRSRTELLWLNKKTENSEKGFLFYTDFLFSPPLKKTSGSLRLQYFETDSYDSRIYAYENDVLYAYSIPAFFDKGLRYYINFNYDPLQKLSFWLRLARTVYKEKSSIGSGSDEIKGNQKTEITFQFRFVF